MSPSDELTEMPWILVNKWDKRIHMKYLSENLELIQIMHEQ